MSKVPKPLQTIDEVALAVFQGLAVAASQSASTSVQKVLGVSANFLSDEAHAALTGFHDLYFGAARQDAAQMNDDVSKMFEEAQGAMDRGEDLHAALAKVDAGNGDAEKNRLALSALQKKLEVVIAMEQSFRDKLVPILSGMQFEDAMNQRLTHLTKAWEQVVGAGGGGNTANRQALAETVAASLSSDAERESFYRMVLQEEPPASGADGNVWLDFTA